MTSCKTETKYLADKQIYWGTEVKAPVKLVDNGPISGSFFIDGVALAIVLITVGFFLGKIK